MKCFENYYPTHLNSYSPHYTFLGNKSVYVLSQNTYLVFSRLQFYNHAKVGTLVCPTLNNRKKQCLILSCYIFNIMLFYNVILLNLNTYYFIIITSYIFLIFVNL